MRCFVHMHLQGLGAGAQLGYNTRLRAPHTLSTASPSGSLLVFFFFCRSLFYLWKKKGNQTDQLKNTEITEITFASYFGREMRWRTSTKSWKEKKKSRELELWKNIKGHPCDVDMASAGAMEGLHGESKGIVSNLTILSSWPCLNSAKRAASRYCDQ